MDVAELPTRIRLEIVTPERVVLSEDVDMVTAPGALGEFGVLPGHTPMLTTLTIGLVAYKMEGRTHELAVSWGYAEVGPDKVTLLAETAEKVEEIDVERAEAARRRAVERLTKRDEELNLDRAMEAIERAALRLRVAGKQK
ncbi:MAG: F0F1 ATP synthase subunit epsilon [Nitrospinota bacterium]